jgi:hypothetical protein
MVHINQLLAYADDENIWGGSVRAIKKNTETLAVISKEAGLEVHADRTNYMVKYFRDQNAATKSQHKDR